MDLTTLTKTELIDCAFVDALPEDREAIVAELLRRMTHQPTGDVGALLDKYEDYFIARGWGDKDQCDGINLLRHSIANLQAERDENWQSKLHWESIAAVALKKQEDADAASDKWRELVRELCGPMIEVWADGKEVKSDYDEGHCGGPDTCHYCNTPRPEGRDYYSLCSNEDCPAMRARAALEADHER